jgi:galactose-1-phosphate uridylyltransferase
LEDHYALKKEFLTLKVEYDKLFDRYNEIEHSYKEINLKFTSLEKTYHYIEQDREHSHAKVIELTQLLHERSVESNNEKRALREFLSRLEIEKGLAEAGVRKEKDFSSYRVAKTNRPLSIADFFVRLKTTSVSSEKYAETLETIMELFKNEQDESKRLGTKLLTESMSV